MSYLIITGSFACGMAFHNTTARYLYSVGREGLAPRALGRTHPRWKSPHIASDHPVGRRRHHHRPVRHLHRQQRPQHPGLHPALRPDGGDGRDHHPVGAGGGLAQPCWSTSSASTGTRRTGGGPGWLRCSPSSPRPTWCTCCSRTSTSSARELLLRELAGPDRRRGGAGRRRHRLLLQEVQARQVRAGRPPDQRRPLTALAHPDRSSPRGDPGSPPGSPSAFVPSPGERETPVPADRNRGRR